MKEIYKMWKYAEKSYSKWTVTKDNDTILITETEGSLIFSPTGSNDLKDWYNNFLKVDWKKEHRGMRKSAEKFEKYISEAIRRSPKKKIIFSGHSRGAGLAIWMARYVAKKGKSCSCYAFAPPKVFDRKLRDEYENLPIDHHTIIVGKDPVPKVPPGDVFKHPGPIIKLKSPNWYSRFLWICFKDHIPKSYTKAIRKYYGK